MITAGALSITNLADGVNPQDAVTMAQLNLITPTDFFSKELLTAISLCAFTKTPLVVVRQSGIVTGPFFEGAFTGGTGNVAPANVNGGGQLLSTGPNAGSTAAIFTAGPTSSAFGQVFDGSDHSFCAFRFKLNTVPDAQTEFGLGVANGGGTDAILVGVQGSGSTAKFRVYRDNGGGAGANTVTNIDTNWHTGRLYTIGDGKIYGQFDSDAAANFTQAYLDNTQPNAFAVNGATAANQEMIFGAAIYVADGN
jgi:hypothetical protein